MSDYQPYILGLCISRHRQSWTNGEIRISVSVVRRTQKERDGWKGCNEAKVDGGSIRSLPGSSDNWHLPEPLKKYYLSDLEIGGFVSKGYDGRPNHLIGYEARYKSVFSIELAEAEKIVATLRRLQQLRQKWHKDNPGLEFLPAVQFLILARFVKAQFVVFNDTTTGHGDSSWDSVDWDFLTVSAGTHKYLREISKLETEWVDRDAAPLKVVS